MSAARNRPVGGKHTMPQAAYLDSAQALSRAASAGPLVRLTQFAHLQRLERSASPTDGPAPNESPAVAKRDGSRFRPTRGG